MYWVMWSAWGYSIEKPGGLVGMGVGAGCARHIAIRSSGVAALAAAGSDRLPAHLNPWAQGKGSSAMVDAKVARLQ